MKLLPTLLVATFLAVPAFAQYTPAPFDGSSSNPFLAPTGCAAPGFSFIDQSDVGVCRNAADVIRLNYTDGGTEFAFFELTNAGTITANMSVVGATTATANVNASGDVVGNVFLSAATFPTSATIGLTSSTTNGTFLITGLVAFGNEGFDIQGDALAESMFFRVGNIEDDLMVSLSGDASNAFTISSDIGAGNVDRFVVTDTQMISTATGTSTSIWTQSHNIVALTINAHQIADLEQDGVRFAANQTAADNFSTVNIRADGTSNDILLHAGINFDSVGAGTVHIDATNNDVRLHAGVAGTDVILTLDGGATNSFDFVTDSGSGDTSRFIILDGSAEFTVPVTFAGENVTALTDATATAFATIAIPQTIGNNFAAGTVSWTIICDDTTNQAQEVGSVVFACHNLAGTESCTFATAVVHTLDDATASLVASTFSFAAGTDTVNLEIDSDCAGVTPSTQDMYWEIDQQKHRVVTPIP